MRKFLAPALALLAMNAGTFGQQASQKPPSAPPPAAPAATSCRSDLELLPPSKLRLLRRPSSGYTYVPEFL